MNTPTKRIEYLESECPAWLLQVVRTFVPFREVMTPGSFGFTSDATGECIRYRIYRDEEARQAWKTFADMADAAKMFDAGTPWHVIQTVCTNAEFLVQLEAAAAKMKQTSTDNLELPRE